MQRLVQVLGTKSARFVAGLGFCCVTAAGVSGCDNPVNSAANHIPLLTDDSGITSGACDPQYAAGGCDCLKVGDVYRFTSLQLTSVDGNPEFAVIPVLNSLWQMDIDNYELNFMVKITELTMDNVEIEVTNAARVGDTKKPCLLPKTAAKIRFPRNGCCLDESETGSINVYAGSQEHTKNCGYLENKTPKIGVDHAIPIRGVKLSARATPDCSKIENGLVLEGSFSKDALFNLCTCQTLPGQSSDVCTIPDPKYKDTNADNPGACDGCGDNWQSLGGLLSAFAGDEGLKYGCKSDTGGPSVCMTTTFTAVKVDPAVWVPAVCPGQ